MSQKQLSPQLALQNEDSSNSYMSIEENYTPSVFDLYAAMYANTNLAIVTEGSIGSGKTTIQNMISELGDYYRIPVKNYQEQIPIELWKKYCQEPKKHAKEFQFTTLESVLHVTEQIAKHQDSPNSNQLMLFERFHENYIFANWHYEHGNLSFDDMKEYQAEYMKALKANKMRYVILYIDVPVEECYERIQARGHTDKDYISLEYLKELAEMSYKHVKECADVTPNCLGMLTIKNSPFVTEEEIADIFKEMFRIVCKGESGIKMDGKFDI